MFYFRIHKLLLTIGVLALLTLPALAADAPQVAYTAKVTGSGLSLFSSADSSSECVGEISQGGTVVLLDDDEGSGWIPASYQGEDEAYTGYVKSSGLEVQSLGTVTALSDSCFLFEEPSTDAETVTMLFSGNALSVLGYDDGWFYAKVGDKLGYIPLADVQCLMTTASRLNFRSGPGTEYDSLCKIPKGTVLSPLSSIGEWVEVTYDGMTGYVSSDYLDADSAYTVEDPYLTDGEAVVAYASQYLGNRYVWGGTSLETGVDCSGYVMKVYEEFGVDLPHSSRSIRNYGTEVSYSEMEAGDVVCYSGHVGIYAGDGQIINALNSRSGICYTDVNYAPIVTIRRML